MMCWREPKVWVYGKSECPQCDMSTKVLDKEGIDFTYIDIEEDDAAYKYVTTTLGFRQAPAIVVRYPDGSESHWAGFRPDKIKGYARTVAAWSRDDN